MKGKFLFYSKRKQLANKCNDFIKNNKLNDSSETIITYLAINGLLKVDKVIKFLSDKNE